MKVGRSLLTILKSCRGGEEFRVNFKPVFPIASTPEEAGQYFVHVEEPSKAKEVLQKLRECTAVETAYHVPPAELP